MDEERVRRVLQVLADNRRKPPLSAGRVWHLACGEQPYRGRRDAGMTRTLDALERRGFVDGRYAGTFSSGRVWRITDAGLAELRSLGS